MMKLSAVDESYSASHCCLGTGFLAFPSEMRDHTFVSLGKDRSREESGLKGSDRMMRISVKRKEKDVLVHTGRSKPDLDPTSWGGGVGGVALNSLVLYPAHHIRPMNKMGRPPDIHKKRLSKRMSKFIYTHKYALIAYF